MKFKFAFVLLLFILTASAWTQNLPGGIWTSPQSSTTEGRYRSNADDFIRPDAYKGLRFDKIFAIAAFLRDDNYNPLATLGFAAKTENFYISAFYSGNFWAGKPADNFTERTFTEGNEPAGGKAEQKYDVYGNINVASQAINNAAILFGFADMGLRLTYRTNYKSFNKDGIVNQDQLYKNYSAQNGYIAPQIAWSMSKDLISGRGIRPYVTVDLVFNRSNLKTETEGKDADGITGVKIGRSSNVFSPSFGIGLGNFHFLNKNGFRLTGDLEYSLSTNVYNNEYSYAEDGTYKTKSFKGEFNPGSFPYVERYYFTNTITPSVAGAWSGEKLALRFKLNFVLVYTSEKASLLALNGSELIKSGNSDITTAFSFRPDLRLALQYKIIPNRLTLNTGARIQASAVTTETVKHNEYNDKGERILPLESKIKRDSFGSNVISRFHIGAAFNFTENVWIEASTGITNAYGDSAIQVFAPSGLLSFGSVLAVIKF